VNIVGITRATCALAAGFAIFANIGHPALADSSSPELASYYERHMAIINGAAYGWTGSAQPQRMAAGVKQVGVGRDSYFALKTDGTLITWQNDPAAIRELMTGISYFASGESGVFAIDKRQELWLIQSGGAPVRIASAVVAASIGDGANYYITANGDVFVKGRAHRGQYGDGRLTETDMFVKTAANANDVKAHTGHAILLQKNGDVLGTGGNIHGPLSVHGLGDKADTWGKIFDGAKAIATGSSHSAAIRADGSLWVWGAGFGSKPRKILDRVKAVAAGSSATIALTEDGRLWQWTGGGRPRQLEIAGHSNN
jgi:hypothetical protein